jgi:GMP synthase (glutamine-hydrolysing)
VLGLSGGVVSSVVAVLLHKAIGDRLHCIFVDNGLLRYGEDVRWEEMFHAKLGMDLHVIDAKARFYDALKGVEEPR